jgi:hypothetical protein
VWTVMGSDVYFHRFELSLPSESTVTRVGETLRITHPLMECNITAGFSGYWTSIPFAVQTYLMPGSTFGDAPLKCEIVMQVKFRLRSVFARRRKIALHNWVTRLGNRLEEKASFQRYLTRIGNGSFEAVMYALESAGVVTTGHRKQRLAEAERDRRADKSEDDTADTPKHWLHVDDSSSGPLVRIERRLSPPLVPAEEGERRDVALDESSDARDRDTS